MRFTVETPVFDALPDLYFGAIGARGITNSGKPGIYPLLLEQCAALRSRLEAASYRENRNIKVYRDSFTKLGMNPNKFMCSIEAMVKRVLGGNDLPSINPIVDISNAMSLKHLVALGAHDMDIAKQGITVRFSREGDRFLPLGCDEWETVDPGELVYADGGEINTRRWIWRQSNNCKITERSCNIFFPMDGFLSTKDEIDQCTCELAELLQQHFGCTVKTYSMDRNNNSIEV